MSEEARTSERARREEALEHKGEVVPESGRPIEPKRVPQVVSLRLDPELISALRNLAEVRESTVSKLLREGAECVLGRSATTWIQWRLSLVEGIHSRTSATIGDVALATSRLVSDPGELNEASG